MIAAGRHIFVCRPAAHSQGSAHDAYLVLGETDIDLFTVDLDGSNPVLRDKVSSDVNETFPSVGAAIQRLLATRG
nr:hypothetical protein [uncultured Sphingomonas sp.]